jgi:hypothetical protein
MPVDELSVEYRIVENFPEYRVGTDGSVWSKQKNTRGATDVAGWHLLQGGTDKDGYKKVILCQSGKRRYCRVNALVLETFIGAPPSDMQNPTAAHDNGVRTDNRLSNLKWASQKDNIRDKVRHGTAQIGEKHPQCRLTEEKVLNIRQMRKSGMKWREIAESVGETFASVYAAGSGRNWKHI